MKHHKAKNAKTFADWAGVAIAKHSQKMLDREAAVLADKDPEELHQMRVGMRRLRSAMSGFSSAISLPVAAAEKNVGKVAKILGKLRDLDVLGEALKTQYLLSLPKKEQKELNKALKILDKRRKSTFDRVRKTLDGKTYTALKKALKQWLKHPQTSEIGSTPINFVLPDLLLPQISEFLLHPGWLVSTQQKGETISVIPHSDSQTIETLLDENAIALHDLRKEAKRTRYQMELFQSFYGEEYAHWLGEIKALQEVLGDIQDSFVLAEFLEDTLAENPEESLPVLAGHLRETRQQRWLAWQTLQQTFLNLKNRDALRSIVQNPERREISLFPDQSEPEPASTRELAEVGCNGKH